jgi:hypothetical protein
MKKTLVTTNYLIIGSLLKQIFNNNKDSFDVSLVKSLLNACLLGDCPSNSNPNFLPDFLIALVPHIYFDKKELTELQKQKRNEIHFVHKQGIDVAKKHLTMNLIT